MAFVQISTVPQMKFYAELLGLLALPSCLATNGFFDDYTYRFYDSGGNNENANQNGSPYGNGSASDYPESANNGLGIGNWPDEDPSTGPVQIGSHHVISISTAEDMMEIQPVVSSNGQTSTWTLYHENASYLSVHFSNMDLPPSCSLRMSDANRGQSTTLRGRGKFDLGSFWASHIKGDTMIISLRCNSRRAQAIFDIDEYVAGFPMVGEATRKTRRHLRSSSSQQAEEALPFAHNHKHRDLAICGADDKRNAICYKDSHPAEYGKARAVARLYIRGSGACTGWLVSGSSMLFTNEHCISSLADVQNTDFEFMGEEEECTNTPGDGSWLGDRGVIYFGSQLLAVSTTWDYALIQLDGNPAAAYGHLEIDNRQPAVDEEIYIPQHPNGRPKEIGIFDSNLNGNCKVMELKQQGGCSPEVVTYSCDTEGGTSGAPVLARTSHKVIGQHQCGGGCLGNQGAPLYQFYSEVSHFFTACQSDSDCNDGDSCTLDVCTAGQCSYMDTCATPAPTSTPEIGSGSREFLTTLAQNNGAWGNIFKIEAKEDLLILGFDVHTSATGSYPVAVWTRAGEPVFDNNDGQWTSIQEATVMGQGTGNRTPLPLLDNSIDMNQGETRSFYISGSASAGMRYTNGVSEGAIFSQNDDLIFFEGRGIHRYPFSSFTFSPRVWNGFIKYAVATPAPTTPPPTPAPVVPPGPCITYELDLLTDTWGHETSWQIARDLDGFVVAQGGGYGNLTNHFETGCIPDDCYRFTIFDTYGDGLGWHYGLSFPPGLYTLKNEGNLVGTGGDFAFEEVVLYGTCASAEEKILRQPRLLAGGFN